MSDLEEEMEETAERAKALGVSGDQPTDPAELEEDADDSTDPSADRSRELAEGEVSTASETLETSETDGSDERDETFPDPGGLDDHRYPNPDKDLGSLIDTYENFNVYVPPAVKDEVNSFHKQLDYEFSQESGEDLDKHWDFYTALFRAVLENREIVRDELGMEQTD